MDKLQQLKALYANRSKHSNYQILSKQLTKFLPPEETEVKSRFEKERLDCILNQIDIENKKILDIGGNTGFFSFELLDNGAKHVHYIEGNKEHADFVSIAGDVLGLADKLTVTNEYVNFKEDLTGDYDIILLLNVLHHIGDDYGDNKLTIENAKQQIIAQLLSLQNKAKYIIFQLGFNWKGNRNLCLFENGTKQELIDFITEGVKDVFEIPYVGIAEKEDKQTVYKELHDTNIQRDDSLGEFLNRPLFILKSLNS